MYKKVIKYTDYNGIEHEDAFYFNLTKFDLMRMNTEHPGGFEDYINRITRAMDTKTLVEVFEKIIWDAYGEKDETGLRFVRSKELSEAFSQTEAYSELMMELITDDKAAAEFINGIMPKIEPLPQDASESNILSIS